MVQFPLAILGADWVYCAGDYKKVAEADFNEDGTVDELYQFVPSEKDQKNCERRDSYQLRMTTYEADESCGHHVRWYQELEYVKNWLRPVTFRTPDPFKESRDISFPVGTQNFRVGDLVHFQRNGIVVSARIYGFQIEFHNDYNWARSAALLGIPEVDQTGGIPLTELTLEKSREEIDQKGVAIATAFEKDLEHSLSRRGILLDKAYQKEQCLTEQETAELKQIERRIKSYVEVQRNKAVADKGGRQFLNQQLEWRLDRFLRTHAPCTTVAKR